MNIRHCRGRPFRRCEFVSREGLRLAAARFAIGGDFVQAREWSYADNEISPFRNSKLPKPFVLRYHQ